jgi:DNA repair protein RecN (Recombination protein N)
MLTYLRISNFAILDEIELEFGPGLTVLTGETGAGKSLILDAVALLRGGRAPAELIRAGADSARIEAVFVPTAGTEPERALHERLSQLGIDAGSLAADGLVVRRQINRNGRGRVHIAGQLSTVQALAEVCSGLIDIAGQHEHQSLLDTSRHLGLLDRSGVGEELRERMTAGFLQLEQAIRDFHSASLDERSRIEREEFLRFQLDEIRAADPQPGEDESLREEQRRLRSATRLHQAASRGEASLYSAEGAVIERLGALGRELLELGAVDRQMATFASQLGEAQALLEDAAQGLRRYAQHLRADPERLSELDDRLHLIGRLLRKHGPDMASLLKKRDEMASELSRLHEHEAHRTAAAATVEQARRAAVQKAEELSAARHAVAGRLAKEASAALADLGMAAARLEARLDRRPAQKGDEPALTFEMATSEGRLCRLGAGDSGWDRCELLLKSNVGEEARPLTRIASGGELSRVMLALRRVLGQADSIATCVFDEVDAGIGGATADRVGRHIFALSRSKQVLCITHLPQIAAYADQHLRVEKQVEDGRTTARIKRLGSAGSKDRRDEIARMLGGARITDRSRAHAEEILRDARQ